MFNVLFANQQAIASLSDAKSLCSIAYFDSYIAVNELLMPMPLPNKSQRGLC